MTDPLDRARAYVAKMPPAIAGQHGHDATFKVALALIHGFGLSEEDAMPIMEEHSNRCTPPWTRKDLEHKLNSAAQHARSGKPRGHLRAAQHRPAPVEPPLPVRPKKKITLRLSAEASQSVEEKTAGSATKSSPGPDPRAAARSGFPAVAPRLAGGRPEVSASSRTTASECHTPQLARDDEAEARRIAGELTRLHRDGAIASKAALDPDAVRSQRVKARCDALLARHSPQKPPESQDRGMTRAGQIRALQEAETQGRDTLEEYARQACNVKAERKAAEIRIRAERKAGQLLKEIERGKPGRPVENNSGHDGPNFSNGQKETPYQQAKREAHISDKQAKNWQQLAALPHGDFEGRLHDPLVKPMTSGIINHNKAKAPPDDASFYANLVKRFGTSSRNETSKQGGNRSKRETCP